MAYNKGKGKCAAFLLDLVGHQGDACVDWPYSSLPSGYGHLGYLGKVWRAHVFICTQAHGPKPTPKHETSHSCHRPICVNPKHLSWKTHSENILQKRENGTLRRNGAWNKYQGKLTPEQVKQVRALRGRKSQLAIGAQFGISESSVRAIYQGKRKYAV